MNVRERFRALMRFEPVDRGLLWESAYWSDTVRRWHREGMPHRFPVPASLAGGQGLGGHMGLGLPYGSGPSTPDGDEMQAFLCGEDIHFALGLDQGMLNVPVNIWMAPGFDEVVLEDHGDWILWRDSSGIVQRDRKDRESLPHWVGSPVRSRDDWEQIKAERLQPNLRGRLPADWAQRVESLKTRDYPLCIGGYPAGFYGSARHLVGQERVLTLFYDDPELAHDIMDHLGDLYVGIYDQVLDQVDVDACLVWEDMCYNAGPLISPAMFRRFILPNYRKLTACLRDHGVNSIIVDTDGDARLLFPLFIEGGVDVLLPCEATCSMDVVELRKAYPRLGLIGGMDKTKLAAGPAAIDAELDYKIPFMMQQGGYIPTVDHQVPPDVSWKHFNYYRSKLNRMIVG